MRKIIVAAIACAVLGIVFVGVLSMGSAKADVPQPLAAPTPVTQTARNAANNQTLTFLNAEVLTATYTSPALSIEDIDVIDLQYVADQTLVAGETNTTTVKLQFSNTGVNWVDGPTVINANAADANDMQQYAVFGKYARLSGSVSNALPFTLTVVGLGK